MQYRSSKSRITKQQVIADELNAEILKYLNNVAEEIDAVTLWLALRVQGNTLSQSTCNNRLKKMVESGLVEKISTGYNKHRYRVITK